MRFLVVALFSLTIAGCETAPRSPSLDDGLKVPALAIGVGKGQVPADTKFSGRNYFLDTSYVRVGLSDATVKELAGITRTHLKSLGFEEVSSRRKSHLMVFLYADRDLNSNDGSVLTATETHKMVMKEGAPVFETIQENSNQMVFQTQVQMNRHGRRPEVLGHVVFRSANEQWTGSEEQLVLMYKEQIVDLLPKAPLQNEKMKGDPGCILRFGFEEHKAKVTSVLKNSPAEKAGIKIGDLVESIDSVPHSLSTIEKLEGAYAQNLKVPIKLMRNGKTIRSQIAADVVCE